MAYIEQVGEYLHTEGNNGPRKSWYARTTAIRTERIISPVSTDQSCDHAVHLRTKGIEWRGIRGWCGFDDDIQRHISWQEIRPDDFAQPPFQSVAVHRSVAMARHDDANPRKVERGSARPDRKMPGSYNFPLLLDSPDVRAATDASRPRVAQARFTRRRIWTEASQSDASDPSCDDDSAHRGPSASTCACEIRASGFASCCGGGMWAFPWATICETKLN